MEILKERFEDRQTVAHSHYGQLISLTPAFNNPESLRLLYDQVEKRVRSLEALQQDISQEVFMSMIIAEFPKDARYNLNFKRV